MFEELLALRVEAETEILYAKAKLEVVEKLMAKLNNSVEPTPVADEPTEYVEETYNEEDVQ